MSHRNPSRAGKSTKEKQFFCKFIKGISSSDTAGVDSPFEPSNRISREKFAEKPITKRPQPFKRKLVNHIKKNSATYIVCLVTLISSFVIRPFILLNREVGVVKSEVNNMKTAIADEAKTNKQQYIKFSDQLSEVLNNITSIKTYLVNKFKARL